jgi:hypothetical protein
LEAKVDGVGMKLENALLRASASKPIL